jgi:hypothetical protein
MIISIPIAASTPRMQRRAQVIQDSELHAQLDRVDTRLVVPLDVEEAGVADPHETDIKTNNKDVDQDEMVQDSTVRFAVPVQRGYFFQV